MNSVANPLDVYVVASDREIRDWLERKLVAAERSVSVAEDLDAERFPAGVGCLLVDLESLEEDWRRRVADFRRMYPRVRVVVTATHADPGRLLSWLRSGIGRVLVKPFTRRELLGALGWETHFPAPTPELILPRMIRNAKIRRGVNDWIEMETAGAPGLEAWLVRWLELYLYHRVPEALLRDIRIGVGEMLANAVEWGNRSSSNARIYISCAVFPLQVIIRIRDEGPGFDPGIVPDPTDNPFEMIHIRKRQGKRVGGYGLFLARKVCTELVFSHKGNSVILVWRIPPAAKSAACVEEDSGE